MIEAGILQRGVVIVPLLALALGVDIHYAIGAALVSVIATSSGAVADYGVPGVQKGVDSANPSR